MKVVGTCVLNVCPLEAQNSAGAHITTSDWPDTKLKTAHRAHKITTTRQHAGRQPSVCC